MKMRARSWLLTTWQYVLHFFFPRTCFACGGDLAFDRQEPLCPVCEKQLKIPGPFICKRCGAVLKSGGAHCYACRGSKEKQYKCKIIRSAFVFNESSRALVHALKYKHADYIAPAMGRMMLRRFSAFPELAAVSLVMPVPLHPKKERARGYNQSERLARSFAQAVCLPLDTCSLIRLRDTVSQTTLNRSGRLANMAGAFQCIAPAAVKGKTILLIDDVATTGATLEGCALALKQAGAKAVFAYTFARE